MTAATLLPFLTMLTGSFCALSSRSPNSLLASVALSSMCIPQSDQIDYFDHYGMRLSNLPSFQARSSTGWCSRLAVRTLFHINQLIHRIAGLASDGNQPFQRIGIYLRCARQYPQVVAIRAADQ